MAAVVITHLLGVVALLEVYRSGYGNQLLNGGLLNASSFHPRSTVKLVDLLPDYVLQLQISSALQIALHWIPLGVSTIYILILLNKIYKLFFGRVAISYRMMDRDISHRVTTGRSKLEAANMARLLRQRGDVPPVYPNGWYEVMLSEELPVGAVKAVSMIGQQLAVFRGENGAVSVMDAYCPHLGAHLGVGGQVRGNCIECPFHGWQYDGQTGQCTKIPYANKVPSFVKVKVWPTAECNGIIFLWFDAEGREPNFSLEEYTEIKQGQWTYRGHTAHYVNCHIEDILENGADIPHLTCLHQTGVAAGTNVDFNQSKWLGKIITHHWKVDWKALPPPQSHIGRMTLSMCNKLFGRWKISPLNFNVVVDQLCPGVVILKFKLLFGTGIFIQTIVPEAPLQQRLCHYIYCDWWIPTFIAAYVLLNGDGTQIERDAIVWSHKTYLSKPVLVKEDQLIINHRRWFQQFYSENSPRLSFKKEDDICF